MDPNEAVLAAVASDEEGWADASDEDGCALASKEQEGSAVASDEEGRAVARYGGGPAGTAAMVATVLLLGPVDVAVTLSVWHLESNPVVLALGPAVWVAGKAATLGTAVWVWHVVRVREGMPALADAWMLLLAMAAATVIGVNLAVVAAA